MIDLDKLESKLRLHRINNPIQSKELEEIFHCPGDQIREAVSLLRSQKKPIGNTIRQGDKTIKAYFWGATKEELIPTIQELRSRGSKIFAVADNLEECFTVNNQISLI
jgi:hypothetical protein